MDAMAQMALANMDLVFFVYGTAFVMLALTALWSPAEHTDHPIAAELGWLAAFGLSHGFNEWVDMWKRIQGGAPPEPIPILLLAGSFVCLLEFGRRLLRTERGGHPWVRGLTSVWLYLPLGAGLVAMGLMTPGFLPGLHTGARYFLGFPAGLLAGAALLATARGMAEDSRRMGWAARIAGIAMLAYGVLSGLVVGPTAIATTQVLNTETFQAALAFPVQVYRALAAVALALSLGFLFHRFNAEIRSKLAQLATTFRTSQAIVIADADGTIRRVNPAFTETTGYTPEEVIGRNPSLLQSGYHDRPFYRAMWQHLLERGYWEGEVWDRTKDGRDIPLFEAISAVPGSDGGIQGYVSVFHDISKQKELETELERQAIYDHLTGLYKRGPLEQFIGQELSQAARLHRPFCLLMLDIDRFKAINDTFGHDFGDEVLKGVTELMDAQVRQADILARWGGEEFMALLPGTDLDGAKVVAERIRQAMADTHFPAAGQVTVSLGIAPYREGDSVRSLIKRADRALYAAKEGGRNRVEVAG